MKHLFALLTCLLASITQAQITIRLDNMELPSTWRGVSNFSNSGYIGGTTAPNDCPTNVTRYFSLDTSYIVYGNSNNIGIEYDTLLYPNITGLNSTKRYSIQFRLASIAISQNQNSDAGVDLNDTIKLEWSPNNGITWIPEIAVIGSGNTCWGFAGGGLIASKQSSSALTIFTSIQQSQRLVKQVWLNNLPPLTQLRIRITSQLDASGETFLIEDVRVIESTVLPIELQLFTATRIGNQIKLKWKTQTETNNDYFSIYKSSNGVQNWQLITTVNGSGNSSIPIEYNYTDQHPAHGLNYYKLTQTDFDGGGEEFPPIVILFVPAPLQQSIWKKYNVLGQELK